MKHKINLDKLRKRIMCAKGEIPADMVLKNGIIANVFIGEFQKKNIAIYDGIIVGLGSGYHGKEEIDLDGAYILPGFIDAHFHIESSMLIPSRLSDILILHGTTCIVADPHEIANVMGKDGIRFMIDDASDSIIDFFFMLPSCVPATSLETSGASLEADDLVDFLNNPYVIGLAEVMNYPGVINCDTKILNKILLFQDKIIDGHCPGLKGSDLQSYITAIIGSDHESIDHDEALEKLENGMFLMIREGSTAKNMRDLLSIVNEKNFHRCCFVADDLHPEDIYYKGHLDFILKKAISLGLEPIKAIQMITINPATYFGMKDRGAIAPGRKADLVIMDNLKECNIIQVYKDGKRPEIKKRQSLSKYYNTINIRSLSKDAFKIPYKAGKVRVIEIIPDQIVNKMVFLNPSHKSGEVISDPEKDILKLCVVERHKGTGNIGLGLVKGFGFKKGAIASSISHDSHNIIAVGVNDEDIYRAIMEIKEMGGGLSVALNNKIIAKIKLEIGGLMTDRPILELIKDMEKLHKAVKNLECSIKNPFMTLSFLALPVIPELRITDMGLVDVNRFEIVPLFLS